MLDAVMYMEVVSHEIGFPDVDVISSEHRNDRREPMTLKRRQTAQANNGPPYQVLGNTIFGLIVTLIRSSILRP